ncbi:hypothetical protein ACRAVF_14670 [Bradyrhizobium oligotrophicum S58]
MHFAPADRVVFYERSGCFRRLILCVRAIFISSISRGALMRKLISSIGFLCVALLILASPEAHAQATRTWVSGVGDDVNPCSRTAPCKTFAGAISKTAAGGEIDVLDPGGYGAVTITKSITIDGGGTMASILASGTNGINVNAGANDVIILRNLSINGAGTTLGLNGINFLAGRKLVVENCTFENFSQSAISVAPTGAAQVVIADSRSRRPPSASRSQPRIRAARSAYSYRTRGPSKMATPEYPPRSRPENREWACFSTG